MSSLKYWLWLSSLRGLGENRTSMLLDELGAPENIFFAKEDEWKEVCHIPDLALRELNNKSTDRAERILEMCENKSIKILTMQDAAYPERLRAIYNPPSVLYYKGRLPSFDEEAALGVVGTRNPTAYGQNVGLKLCYKLSAAGMYIISGMAKGADTAAHIGALRAGRPTAAVLGCGLDVIYPAENRELYEDIIASGVVISQYPPGTKAEGPNFPARNRIISGLSLGVLVIEAPIGSGALITANHALDQGRDVFAIPGNIDNPESAGCHRLIREGAVLVSCAEDITSEYMALFSHKLTKTTPKTPTHLPKLKPAAKKPEDKAEPESEAPVVVRDLTELIKDFSPERQQILSAIAKNPMLADEIIGATNLPAPLVLSELTMLEIDGIIEPLPGRRFQLVLKRLEN